MKSHDESGHDLGSLVRAHGDFSRILGENCVEIGANWVKMGASCAIYGLKMAILGSTSEVFGEFWEHFKISFFVIPPSLLLFFAVLAAVLGTLGDWFWKVLRPRCYFLSILAPKWRARSPR